MEKETLFKIKKRLEKLGNKSIGEAGTKESFINPLISDLGWDIADFDEVKLEYKHTKKANPVDYALLIDMTPKLYIEAKQVGSDIDEYKWIAQVLTYSNMAGVKWALLTNGNHYKLFNTTAEAKVDEKLLYEWRMKKLTEANVDKVLNFLNLLTKEKLRDDEIEKVWQNHFEVNKVKKSLEKLINDKEDSLLNLIKKKTKLQKANIVNSLNKLDIKIESSHLPDISIPTPEPKPVRNDFTGKIPERAKLFNEYFEVKTWRDLLVNTAEKLIKLNPDAFNRLPDSDIMKTVFGGTFLTRDKSLLHDVYQLTNGLFLEINLDSNSIVRVIKRRLLKGCGYEETDIEIFLKD